jgi:hypothetical protein
MIYVTIQDIKNPGRIVAGDISLAAALDGFNDLLYNSTNFPVTIQDLCEAMVVVTAERLLDFGLQMPDDMRHVHEFRYVFARSTDEKARKLNYLDRFVQNAYVYARAYLDACTNRVQHMLEQPAV